MARMDEYDPKDSAAEHAAHMGAMSHPQTVALKDRLKAQILEAMSTAPPVPTATEGLPSEEAQESPAMEQAERADRKPPAPSERGRQGQAPTKVVSMPMTGRIKR